ncbi:MAG: hypothetical protein V3T84_04735, partial [Phycisphaerales bacterium]
EESFSPTVFISGDTQWQIPAGIALTASGRVQSTVQFTLTGGGGAGARFAALQLNGTITLETVAAQGVMDLYSVNWNGATFDTGTLLRLETIIPGGEDLRDQQTVVGVVLGAIPPQEHDRIANRLENIERVLNGITLNIVPGGPSIGPIAAAFPPGTIFEARHSFLTVSTTRLGTVGVTSVVKDSANISNISFVGTLDVDITASGAGGLDTGVEASDTWYAVHVIGDSTGVNATSILLSVSFTSPTLPITHDIFRRVGAVRNDSASDFLSFVQAGLGNDRSYIYDDETATALNVLSGGSATVFATVDLSDFVPESSTRAFLRVDFDQGADGNSVAIRVPGSSTSLAESYQMLDPGDLPNAPPLTFWLMEARTDANQDIEYEVSNVLDNVDISVHGFIDEV